MTHSVASVDGGKGAATESLPCDVVLDILNDCLATNRRTIDTLRSAKPQLISAADLLAMVTTAFADQHRVLRGGYDRIARYLQSAGGSASATMIEDAASCAEGEHQDTGCPAPAASSSHGSSADPDPLIEGFHDGVYDHEPDIDLPPASASQSVPSSPIVDSEPHPGSELAGFNPALLLPLHPSEGSKDARTSREHDRSSPPTHRVATPSTSPFTDSTNRILLWNEYTRIPTKSQASSKDGENPFYVSAVQGPTYEACAMATQQEKPYQPLRRGRTYLASSSRTARASNVSQTSKPPPVPDAPSSPGPTASTSHPTLSNSQPTASSEPVATANGTLSRSQPTVSGSQPTASRGGSQPESSSSHRNSDAGPRVWVEIPCLPASYKRRRSNIHDSDDVDTGLDDADRSTHTAHVEDTTDPAEPGPSRRRSYSARAMANATTASPDGAASEAPSEDDDNPADNEYAPVKKKPKPKKESTETKKGSKKKELPRVIRYRFGDGARAWEPGWRMPGWKMPDDMKTAG